MDNTDIEVLNSKTFVIVEIIEYVPNAVVIKTIIKKTTDNITAVFVDAGESITEKISPSNRFIQIIEGRAEILIDDDSQTLETRQSIIIPARSAIKCSFLELSRFGENMHFLNTPHLEFL